MELRKPLLILITLLFFFAQAGFAVSGGGDEDSGGIEFMEGTWKEVKEKAQQEDKYIFLDCYTTWCGFCKLMDKKVFPLNEVGDFYNKHFISYRMDMEKGMGVELAKKYNVKSFPTFLYFNPDGEVRHRAVGYSKADKFIKREKNAMDPENQYYALVEKFESGKRDKEFLYNLAYTAKSTNDPNARAYIDEYYNILEPTDKLTKQYLNGVVKFINNIESEHYQVILDKKELYYEKAGKELTDKTLLVVAMQSIQLAGKNEDEALFEKALKLAQEYRTEKYGKSIDKTIIYYYKKSENWTKYADKVSEYIEKNEITNANVLNNYAWSFYENIEVPAHFRAFSSKARSSIFS